MCAAGVEGTQANQVNAREQYIEFLELMDRAKANGARLDKQIVAIFNTWGYPNARGGAWKINNYSRVKMKALADKLNYSHEPDSTVKSIDEFKVTDTTISVELSTTVLNRLNARRSTQVENTVEADVSTDIDDVCWEEICRASSDNAPKRM